MAAYRRVYDSRHLQADCQEPGSAAEPCARQSSVGYLYLLGPPFMAYRPDPLLVSRFVLGRPVAVGGKCRPISLLSGAVPLYAPTVNLPCRTAYRISAHVYAETPPAI